MAYNDQITRDLVAALSSEDVSRQLLEGIRNESLAMQQFRRTTLSKNQQRLPVVEALPQAYFVNGDTGLKQTTQMSWADKFLNVEELAVIIPIPEAVLDDSDYDIWGEVRPKAVDAAVRALDAAVLFGTNKPASWPDAIVPGAVAAGHTVTRGTNADADGGIAGDISDAFAFVEQDGFVVEAAAANTVYKGFLRNARNAQGDRHPEVNQNEVYGVPVTYPARGLWPVQGAAPSAGVAEFIVGDPDEAILGIRQDFTWKVLDQAALFDNTGALMINLPQQDAIALRMVFRCAYQVANTIRYDNTAEATRYPFAVIESPDLA